jgi:hypothetical protein
MEEYIFQSDNMKIIDKNSIFDMVIGKRNGGFCEFLLLSEQRIEVDELLICSSIFTIFTCAGLM